MRRYQPRSLAGSVLSALLLPSSVSEDRPGPSLELVARARVLADEHQRRNGRRIPKDRLRAQLHVSNATAGELLRLVRGPPSLP